MSVLVNGKKVAGTGPAGLSPYQIAVAGGYTGTEQEFNQRLAQLDQLFTSVSEGKSAVAAAITDKGVTTAADATFQQMADNINAIQSGAGINLVSGMTGVSERGHTIMIPDDFGSEGITFASLCFRSSDISSQLEQGDLVSLTVMKSESSVIGIASLYVPGLHAMLDPTVLYEGSFVIEGNSIGGVLTFPPGAYDYIAF